MHPPVKQSVVVEFDSETGHYTATVPGMPGIVVDAKTERTAVKLAVQAIAMYRAEGQPALEAKVVSVDV
jgi:predicted RNase H-like HicB family nuclease